MFQHSFKRLLWLSLSLLLLSGCAEDISSLFTTVNGESFSPTQTSSELTTQSTTQSTTTATSAPFSTQPVLNILSHPQSLTVYQHQPLTLSVKAESNLPIRYQWYKNNLMIAGANQADYSVQTARSTDQGYYHVVLKTDQTERRSLTARVSFRIQQAMPTQYNQTIKPLALLKQPVSQTVSEGSPFTLAVSVQSSSVPSYQWYRGDFPITGARSASYRVLSAGPNDQGSYSVQVRDTYTSIRSKPASITVSKPDTASIELSWDTPKTREDGTPLATSEIQAYVIEFGHYFYDLNERVTVRHQPTNRYVLQDLRQGTLYLRIATIDNAGYRGAFSDTISVYLH